MQTSELRYVSSDYAIGSDAATSLQRDGFVHLLSVINAAPLAELHTRLAECVAARNKLKDVPMEERTTYQKAFLQIMNLASNHVLAGKEYSHRIAWLSR